MATVGSLAVRVSANTRPYQQGMRGTRRPAQQMQQQMRNITRRAARMTAAIAAVGAAMATHFVRQGLQSVDQQAKLARQLDSTMASVRGLQLAASEAGVEASVMDRAMEQLNSRLGEAQRGSGSAADALDRLGLSAESLAGMDIDERFATIADRAQELGLSSAQLGDELRQMGIRQGEVIQLMQQGGDAIRNATRDIEGYGLALDATDAAKVEQANDALGRIGTVVEGVQQQMAVALAPVITTIAQRFNDAAVQAGGWGEQARAATESVIRGTGAVLDSVGGFISRIQNIPVVGTFGLLGFMFFGVKGAAVVGLVVAAIDQISERLARMRGETTRTFSDIEDEITRVEEAMEGLSVETGGRRAAEQQAQLEKQRESLVGIRDQMIENQRETMGQDAELDDVIASLEEAERETENWGATIQRLGQNMRGLEFDVDTPAMPDVPDRQMDGGGDSERVDEEMEARREAMERRLEIMREGLMEEDELQEHKHEQDLERLQEALEMELLTEKEHREMLEELEQAHGEKMVDIRKRNMSDLEKFTAKSFSAQAAHVADSLQRMTASTAGENKKMFRLNKAAGIANALVNTYQGVSQALAAYPPPLSFAMAAAQLAAGMAQVSAIKSQSFSGGGGGSAGSVGSAPSQAGARSTEPGTGAGETQTTRREITIRGEGITGALVREMIPELNEALDDGTRLQAG